MKFICDQCSTKYSIADEKVRRKVLKIRCKNCGNIIVVRDPTRGTGALAAVPTEGGRALDEAFQQVFSESPPATRSVTAAAQRSTAARVPTPAPALVDDHEREPEDDNTRISLPGELRPHEAAIEDEWYLAVDGHQFGPMSFDELCRRVRRGEARSETGDEAFVWRDGFEDWIDAHSVPELRPFVPPRPPPRGRGSGLLPLPADRDRSGAAAGLPAFGDPQVWPVSAASLAVSAPPARMPAGRAAVGARAASPTGEVSGPGVSEAFSLEALAALGSSAPGLASAGQQRVEQRPEKHYSGQQPMVGAPAPQLMAPAPLVAPPPPRVSGWLKLGVVLSFVILMLGGSALVYLLFFDARDASGPRGLAGIGTNRLGDLDAADLAGPDAGVAAGLEFAPVQVGRSRDRPGSGRGGSPETPAEPVATAKPAAREPDDGMTPEQRRLLALYGEKDNGAVPRTARESSATRGPARDLTDREIQKVLAQHRGRIQSCYERASKRDYSLGELRVDATVDVGPSGRVRTVSLKGVESEVLVDCLRSTLRQLVFKPIGGDGATLSMPFIFRGA
ncbi:MAG: zinc-ribbon domain-containing protein [Proteobacteria bacterium]|nr:zinc-ribbon domain-containing protein [Pseudomonadota bacterium]